jgi:PAS domain S-box-containing protein
MTGPGKIFERMMRPLQSEDEEANLRARILFVTVHVAFIGVLILFGMRLLASDYSYLAPLAAILPLQLLLFVLLYRKRFGAVSHLLLTSFLGLCIYLAIVNDGIHDTAIVAIPGVLIVAGLLLRRRHFYLFTAVTLFALAVVTWQEQSGFFHARVVQRNPLMDGIDIITIVAITALTIQILTSRLMTSLRQEKQHAIALRENEERFRGIFENTVIGLYRTAPDGRILMANPTLLRMLGYGSFDDLAHRNLEKEGFEPSYDRREFRSRMELEGEIIGLESAWTRCNGTTIFVRENAKAIRRTDGTVAFYEGSVEDISERKRAEEEVRRLLHEKEIILQEVHHRIKNNMHVIFSLLTVQAAVRENLEAKKILQDAAGRLKSMMVLYDKLYRSEFKNVISLKEYFPSLIQEIVSVFPHKTDVKIKTSIADIPLSTRLLSPLGILLNELITNALKYAFIDREEGVISVVVMAKGNRIVLQFSDDGVGMPPSVSIQQSTGFGLELIGMLTRQIQGTIAMERGEGTRFILESALSTFR